MHSLTVTRDRYLHGILFMVVCSHAQKTNDFLIGHVDLRMHYDKSYS